jgi:hypothetical protein
VGACLHHRASERRQRRLAVALAEQADGESSEDEVPMGVVAADLDVFVRRVAVHTHRSRIGRGDFSNIVKGGFWPSAS